MRQIDSEHPKAMRNPERPDREAGIAAPGRNPAGLFHGWGPKLMVCAFAMGSIAFADKPAMADTQHVAMSACVTPDRGALLLSNPTPELPAGVSTRGTTVMRIDVSPSGHVDDLAVVQSAGDPRLDYEAMRVARASRYAYASHNCTAINERVLYAVIFGD